MFIFLLLVELLLFVVGYGSITPVPLVFRGALTSQNSQSNTSAFAVDGQINSYSLTSPSGPFPAIWQGLLDGSYYVTRITLKKANCCPTGTAGGSGTTDCCPFKLQDIRLEIVDFEGDVNEDFNNTATFQSWTLNPGGVSDLPEFTIDLVASPIYKGNLIRVVRIPSSDPTGESTPNVLGIGEIEAEGVRDPCDSCASVGGECVPHQINSYCQCKPGFYGDGITCEATLGTPNFLTFEIREITSSWKTIPLSLSNPVIVCTPIYNPTHPLPAVIKLRSSGVSLDFNIRAATISTSLPPPISAYCIAIERGVYDGMEAFNIVLDNTNCLGNNTCQPVNNWIGTSVTLHRKYKKPIVLGQIMTSNDPQWLSFWSSDPTNTSLPLQPYTTSLRLGKHSGSTPRSANYDVIGYIVIEEDALQNFSIQSGLSTLTPDITVRFNEVSCLISSISGINQPSWPVLTPLTNTPNQYTVTVTSDDAHVPSYEHISYALIKAPLPLVYPLVRCENASNVCDCISLPDCGWCKSNGTLSPTSACYPSDSSAYCLSISNEWVSDDATCFPIPIAPTSVPVDTPAAPPTATLPPSPPPSPVAPPVIEDRCSGLEICKCLGVQGLKCSWCRTTTSSKCIPDVPSNEADCKNLNGVWIGHGNSCAANYSDYHAAHTLSAFGQQTSVASAWTVLILGILVVTIAVGTFLWVLLKGCCRGRKMTDNL